MSKTRLIEILRPLISSEKEELLESLARHLLENDVAPRAHGNWQRLYPRDEDSAVVCSVCKTRFDYIDGIAYLCYPDELPKYCPECGARMDKTENISGTFSF